MRYALFHVSLLLALIVLGIACSSNNKAESAAGLIKKQYELAHIMRVMEQHGDEVRRALVKGEALPSRPIELVQVKTAMPTKGMYIDTVFFSSFADSYLYGLDLLYEALEKDRRNAYNNLITTCENCHSRHCPGPLMKIEKMYLNDWISITTEL